GCEATQALLLVLVVGAESTALLDEAAGAVGRRCLRPWEDRHDHRLGLVGDVHRGDVVGGFSAPLLECLAVDNNDIAADDRHGGVNCDGAAERRIDRESRDKLGTLLVGDVEDHHPGALPRTVGAIGDHVSTAMEAKAELAGEGVTAGEPAFLLRRIRLASGLVLSWLPPLPGDLRIL